MGHLTDTQKAQILMYPNANHIIAEIGRKIGFSNSAIWKFLSFDLGGMSASGDFSVSMSFPRKRDPGTWTKNKIVTDWQLSVMRIQINKNPSMAAWQLQNKCVLAYRTFTEQLRCLKVLLHKKASFPFIWRLLYYVIWKWFKSFDSILEKYYHIWKSLFHLWFFSFSFHLLGELLGPFVRYFFILHLNIPWKKYKRKIFLRLSILLLSLSTCFQNQCLP